MTRFKIEEGSKGNKFAGLVSEVCNTPGRCVLIQVSYEGSERPALRRLATLKQSLVEHGVLQQRIFSHVKAGLVEETAFFIYDELPHLPPAEPEIGGSPGASRPQ